MSYTYAIVDIDSYRQHEGWSVKIGKSGNPTQRLGALRTANPGRLHLAAQIPGGEWEPLIHEMFAEYRLCGEWFRLDHGRLTLFATLAHEHDMNACNEDLLDDLLALGSNEVRNPCLIEERSFQGGMGFRDAEIYHEEKMRVAS